MNIKVINNNLVIEDGETTIVLGDSYMAVTKGGQNVLEAYDGDVVGVEKKNRGGLTKWMVKNLAQ